MIERDLGIAKLIEGGFEFKTAAKAFDILKPLFEAEEVDAARAGRNARYYETHAEEIKAKAKAKRELRRLKNPVKTPIKTVKTHSDAGYLARIGTPQHDAWNAYTQDTTRKSLPYSDKHNGWWVASEWPPGSERQLRAI